MPALVHPDKVIATDVAESTLKQCITVVEKKVRNLEKRKSKLDAYQMKQTEGVQLNKDQQDAVSKYEVVLQNLDFARDLHKQFQMMLAESEKMMRKQAKREKVERQQQEAVRLQGILKLKTVLSGLLKSHIKADFLNGTHGALVLSGETVEQLCQFEGLIRHSEDLSDQRLVEEASEHMVAYLDGKESPILGTTYKVLQEAVQQIIDCGYFNRPANTIKSSHCEDTSRLIGATSTSESTASTSDPPSPLSCPSAASHAEVERCDSPPSIESIAAKLTLDEQENVLPVFKEHLDNSEKTADNSATDVAVEESACGTNIVQPFTFETTEAEKVSASKKDAREIVSAFDGHFNFLQESLIDEEWSFSNSQPVATSSSTYIPVDSFPTSHANFPAPVATFSASSVFPATVDTFSHNYIAEVDASEPQFDPSVSSQQPVVTFANHYSAPVPYIAPPMINEAYFAHHNVSYGHQVAYTAAYGSVMPSYASEPIVAESHLDTAVSCIYPVHEETTSSVNGDVTNLAYETAGDVYPVTSFSVTDTVITNADGAFSENKMESSALNPNASEFRSRYTPPPMEYAANVDGFAGPEEDGRAEAFEHAETNGDYQDVSRSRGFRGRGRAFRGSRGGGRYNNNRGGYGQRFRNGFHRDGFSGDFNGSSWRVHNRGVRGGINGSRGGRGFARNNVAKQELAAAEDSSNKQ